MAKAKATSPWTGEEIISRLERVEAAIFRDGSNQKHRKTTTALRDGASLPERILRLREEKFLKQPKTASEVHAHLTPKYPCEFDRVTMALLRLQRRRALRKTSKVVDGRRYVAYVW